MDKPIALASTSLSDRRQAKGNRARAASELAEKIAALPALHPYAGAARRNVYLFTPTEAERDLIVQALRTFAAAYTSNRSS
jgi:hypothetical protein